MPRQSSNKVGSSKKNNQWDPGHFLLAEDCINHPMDFATLFPNQPTAPVEIEIGIGKGTFLLARGRQRPEINLLGIEYAKPYAAYSADRARRANLENIRVMAADAEAVFKNCLADRSLRRVHIYFPDPWPKRRHNRRRLIKPPFVQDVRRVLKPGGQLLIVTDHRDYFDHMRRVLVDVAGFARTNFPDLSADEETIVGTNFEKKYIEEGRWFHRMALMKYD